MKNKLFASEINGLIATFVILFILQFKSNLLPLYFPLLLLITIIGYFKKRLIHLIVLLNLSFIYLTINQVSRMFSGNQLNYLPTIMKENFGIFELDFTSNITYPYPVYKYLNTQLIDLFNINILNYLNFLSLLMIFFMFCLISYSFFRKNYLTYGLIAIILLSPSILQFLFVKIIRLDRLFALFLDQNIWLYKHIILKINDYISSGFAHFSLFTTSFEPSLFDILLLPAIYMFSKEKYLQSFFLCSISLIMHTYNIVPISVLVLTYLIKQKRNISIYQLLPIIVSFSFVAFYSITNLSSSNDVLLLSDNILTNYRIQNHRLFNGQITFLSLVTFDLNNFSFHFGGNYPGTEGFTFELELIIFYIIIAKFIDNNLKLFFKIVFTIIILSMFLSYFNETNIFGSYIRTFTPWRLSILIYFFGSLIAINKMVDLVGKKVSILNILLLLLIGTFAFFEFNNTNSYPNDDVYEVSQPFYRIYNFSPVNNNEDLLKEDFTRVLNKSANNSKIYLIDYYDTKIIFSTLLSTSGNYIAHPYKGEEIVRWWENKKEIDFIFTIESCEEIIERANELGFEGIIFTIKNPAFDSLVKCENEIDFVENEIYFINIES